MKSGATWLSQRLTFLLAVLVVTDTLASGQIPASQHLSEFSQSRQTGQIAISAHIVSIHSVGIRGWKDLIARSRTPRGSTVSFQAQSALRIWRE